MAEERLPVGEARQGVSELPPRLAQERQGVCQEGQHPWIFHVLGGTGEAMKRCQGYFLLYFNLFLLIALAEDGTARGTVASQGERHADARLLWRRSRRGRHAASHQQHHGQRTHAGKQRLAQIFESQLFDDASFSSTKFFYVFQRPCAGCAWSTRRTPSSSPAGTFACVASVLPGAARTASAQFVAFRSGCTSKSTLTGTESSKVEEMTRIP